MSKYGLLMPSDIFSFLNAEQSEAVRYKGGPLLIVAGAGSGKTRVLTHRIAYFISEGISPDSILAVTFTNKAARVMRERISALVRGCVSVGTFHSAALSILRENSDRIGFPDRFNIYDEQDQTVIIKESMDAAGIDRDQFSPKGILEVISRAKDDLITPAEFERAAEDRYEEMVSQVYRRYQEALVALKGMDFGDLLAYAVRLFETNDHVRKLYQRRYRYIFVDEYQDTNHAQYRFIMNLARAHGEITVVGDPDQSIYAWRGADIRNILDFEKDFDHVKVVRLEQNYRSTRNILDGANALIRHNIARKEKNLRSTRGEGELIQLYEASDDKGEARFVVSKVLEYAAEGKSLRRMSIFYRTHAQSRVLEDELRLKKVPYKIIGGVRFYDRKEIKDLIAYLRVIAAPYDTVSLKRIINVPPRGLGKKSMDRLNQVCEERRIPLYEILEDVSILNELPGKARSSLIHFRDFMDKYRAKLSAWNVTTLLEKILAKTGYVNILEIKHTLEARVRLENIREFLTVVEEFENGWTGPGTDGMLEAFLERLSLATDMDRWNESEETLTMMTLHTAKGLEFPIVFMVGMEHGLFPYGANDFAPAGDLEEERRLCYVGMTRARDILHMSYANVRHIYGIRNYGKPSRFLSEIPSSLIEFSGFRDTAVRNEGSSGDLNDNRGDGERGSMSVEVEEALFSDDELSDDTSIDIGKA